MADNRVVHIIYTASEVPGGEPQWLIESPQIPELIGGRVGEEQLLNDTAEILEFAEPGITARAQFIVHEQHHVVDLEGDEYLIRWCHDQRRVERNLTVQRLNFAILSGYSEDEKRYQPRSVTTERLLIAVVPTDTVGWVEDQLDEGGSAVLNYDAGGVLWSVPFKDASGALAVPTWPMEKLGLTRHSTFAELLDAVVNTELEGVPLQRKVRGQSMPLADSMRS